MRASKKDKIRRLLKTGLMLFLVFNNFFPTPAHAEICLSCQSSAWAAASLAPLPLSNFTFQNLTAISESLFDARTLPSQGLYLLSQDGRLPNAFVAPAALGVIDAWTQPSGLVDPHAPLQPFSTQILRLQ